MQVARAVSPIVADNQAMVPSKGFLNRDIYEG